MNATTKDDLREIMQNFDTTRARWIEKYGSDEGHGEWFSEQVANIPANHAINVSLRKTNGDILGGRR